MNYNINQQPNFEAPLSYGGNPPPYTQNYQPFPVDSSSSFYQDHSSGFRQSYPYPSSAQRPSLFPVPSIPQTSFYDDHPTTYLSQVPDIVRGSHLRSSYTVGDKCFSGGHFGGGGGTGNVTSPYGGAARKPGPYIPPNNQLVEFEQQHRSELSQPAATGTTYGTETFPRLRSIEENHRVYRGGFRPPLDDGFRVTESSLSSYHDDGSTTRATSDYRSPEVESLLSIGKGSSKSAPSFKPIGIFCEKEGENQPFIGGSVEPVKLTPSWEQRNVSKEELNFNNVCPFEPFEVDPDPPADKFALVFLTLVLHGIGTLMPWNMFITAKNYFVNYKLGTATVDTSVYTTNFLPYLGYASQVPNVLFNWINIFVQFGGSLTSRIVGSIVIEVIIFVITVILAMLDSSDWPGIFFWVTMVSVVILNTANGIYQNTIYGLAARLPFKYTGAVILGSNVSGTFTAVINILAIALAPNQRTSAIYYFITALFVLLACFDTYFALPLNRFYRFHDQAYTRAQLASKRTPGKARVPYWHIFKSAFPQLFNVFMVFFVTLAVFPAVLADTCRTEENFFVSSKYFQAVTCFLTFNLFAMIGNMIPGIVLWPGPKFLIIPVLLRLFFIPAFVLCHYYPFDVQRTLPVLIDSDWAYWVLAIFLGLSSGYYSSLAMMYCPRTVEPEYASVAGMMGAASLITGIFAGINFQVVCSYIVTSITLDIPGLENTFRNCTDRSLPS